MIKTTRKARHIQNVKIYYHNKLPDIRSTTWLMLTNNLDSHRQGKVGKMSVILTVDLAIGFKHQFCKPACFQQITENALISLSKNLRWKYQYKIIILQTRISEKRNLILDVVTTGDKPNTEGIRHITSSKEVQIKTHKNFRNI